MDTKTSYIPPAVDPRDPVDATQANAPRYDPATDPSRPLTKDEAVSLLRAIENRAAAATSDIPHLARIIRQHVMGDTRLDRDLPAGVADPTGPGAPAKS
jgi:hypothetical protein